MTGRTPLPAPPPKREGKTPPAADVAMCPSAADLERMLADELPAERARAVEAHVASCSECQAELERLTDTPSSVGIDLSVTRTGRGDAEPAPRGPGPLPEIPGYLVERELGRGGMGVVYLARQLRLNRPVALKMILAGEFASAEVARRFLAEAEVVARVSHPHIVQVFDFGDVHGRAYFAMEYVEGGTLADRMTGTPWPPHEAARLIELVARGLHAAHDVGVIHRDLKPANILLGNDEAGHSVLSTQYSALRPKIADFGVAKLTEGGEGLTLSQSLIGSPNYMAPEQAEGRSSTVGPAADVWALGAVLYELLTGRKAFDGPTPLGVLEQVKGAEPPPPSRLARGIPRDLETICRACLVKDPRRRYASAALLAEDLRRFRSGETILARPVSRGQRLVRWARRHPVESGLVAALFLALGLGLLGTSWKWREAVRERNAATANQTRAEAGEAAATVARDAWQRLTSEAAFARGDDLARRGDVTAGLFWLHEALRTAPPDDPHWAELVRCNLGGWDERVHALERTVPVGSPANTAALSPDGSLLLIGAANGQATLVETNGAIVARLPVIRGGVECVAFSPDGSRAVLGGLDGIWRVDVKQREMIDRTPHIAGKAFRCAMSPDGRRLAVATLRRTAAVWDLESGKAVRTFDTGSDDVVFWSVAYSPDGKSVCFGLKRQEHLGGPVEAQVWPVEGGPVVRLPHAAAVLCVRFHSTDEQVLLTSSADGRARLWDVAHARLRGEPIPHPHSVLEHASFTPDGRTVVTACTDGWVRWWDANDGRPLGSSLRHDGSAYGVAFDAAGRRLATHSADHTVRLWSVSPAALPGRAPLATANKAVVAADGSSAVVAGTTLVRLLDVNANSPTDPPREVPQGRTTPLAVAPGGRFAAVDEAGRLHVWENGQSVINHDLQQKSHALTFDPAGDRLAVAVEHGIVQVWDVKDRKQVHTLRHGGIAWMAAFDPTGRYLAVGSSGAPTACVWDLSGPDPTAADLLAPEGVGVVQFAPDGRTILTQYHRIARLWDASTRQAIGRPMGPFDATYHMRFSPDGTVLASWCGRQVRLWDPATGEPRAGRTFDHAADVVGVTMDAGSTVLVAALADRTAQFWDLRTGRPLGPPVVVGARPLAVSRVAATNQFFAVGDDARIHPLAMVPPAAGSVDELAERLRRRTGFQMAAGTVSPLLWNDLTPAGP